MKVMKRKQFNRRIHWTTVWLLSVLALTGAVFVTYAAYTEVSSVKRVVSTTSTQGELFSSNCMRPDISSRRLTSKEYTITVCNFDQERPTTFNPSEIKYRFYAQLQVKKEDEYVNLSSSDSQADKAVNYFVSKTEDDVDGAIASPVKLGFSAENGYMISFAENESLRASKSSIDKYKVEIDEADLNNPDTEIFVHVWAEPSTPSNLKKIEARLYATQSVTDNASWTGEFLETDCATIDYDFYNYIISGSGAGEVDILWNPDKLEINRYFFIQEVSGATIIGDIVSIPEGDTSYPLYPGWNKVTIRVDSTVRNRYELQLYKTRSGISYTGANAVMNDIYCEFRK